MGNPPRQDVLRILARELNVSFESLAPEKTLRAELGMDSIIALNLIFAMEKELGITIREEDIVGLSTVGDIEALLGRRPS